MPLKIFEKFYTRGLVRRTPHLFYIFGDNTLRYGKKGQAVIRGLPNAIGIATKWKPSKDEDAYFTDDQFENNPYVKTVIDTDLNAVEALLRKGRTIYLPQQMIGSGLAELDSRAPKTFAYVANKLKSLYIEYKDEGLDEFLI